MNTNLGNNDTHAGIKFPPGPFVSIREIRVKDFMPKPTYKLRRPTNPHQRMYGAWACGSERVRLQREADGAAQWQRFLDGAEFSFMAIPGERLSWSVRSRSAASKGVVETHTVALNTAAEAEANDIPPYAPGPDGKCWSCTCDRFIRFKKPCSHIAMVRAANIGLEKSTADGRGSTQTNQL